MIILSFSLSNSKTWKYYYILTRVHVLRAIWRSALSYQSYNCSAISRPRRIIKLPCTLYSMIFVSHEVSLFGAKCKYDSKGIMGQHHLQVNHLPCWAQGEWRNSIDFRVPESLLAHTVGPLEEKRRHKKC